MSDFCRLCATINDNDKLFGIFNADYQIITKVQKLCQIDLHEFDYLPQNCCFKCLDTINRFIEFIDKCLIAQDTLKRALSIKHEPKYYEVRNVIKSADANFYVKEEAQELIEAGLGQDEPSPCEKLSKRKSKSPTKNTQHFDIQKTSIENVIEEEWIVSVGEAPIRVVANEMNSIYSDDIIEDDGSINDGEIENFIPGTANSQVEVTVEPFSPNQEMPEYGIKDEQAVKNLDSWNEYPWSCVECQKKCTSVTELREHFNTHQQTIKYHCIDCNKIYIKYLTFLNHVRRRHRPHLKLCCDICSKFFCTKLYRKHRSMHGDDELTHNCTMCQKMFRSGSALHSHIKTHLSADERDLIRCEICDKTFDLRASLLIHKRIHSGVKDFTCDQCGKSFIQKGNLESHLLTHIPLQPFSCSICSKAFKTQFRLNNHMSVHTGLKPHKCDICGRQFREKCTLREHLRIHTGAMPFACEFCDKRFRFKGILTTHLRQHTGERPYSCLECNHHFTNWPNFNKHMKRRHGVNTSVSTRRPQTIPPSGMPPLSKLNYVVPTVDNNREAGTVRKKDEEDSISTTFYVNDADEAISDMQQIIEEQELQHVESPSLISHIPTDIPTLSFYTMQNVDLIMNGNSSPSF